MNIDAIFDAFHKTSVVIHTADEARRKREQLTSVMERRCGNCDHWMKSSCVREKVHKEFKSSSSYACVSFVRDWMSKDLEKTFQGELTEIEGRLAALRR